MKGRKVILLQQQLYSSSYTHFIVILSGIYDYEYLDYVVSLLKKCKEYQFKVYIDPHQDCVSKSTIHK